MTDISKTEHLTVDFHNVKTGWLSFKLSVGQQTFDDSFSDVYDPLLDLKHWLEAISVGVQQTSFQYDNEFFIVKFDFERVCRNKEVLTISEAYDDGQIFIKESIDRRQLVKAFYFGLLNFANSDKFKSEEWEIEYMKERLCKMLEIDEKSLIEQLIELDKKGLGKLLFEVDPTYYISYPEAKDKNDEWLMFVQDTIDRYKGISNDLKRVETPIMWNIPDDYDFWTIERKGEYIVECLNEKASGYEGVKINDFRSSIIEKYIEEE